MPETAAVTFTLDELWLLQSCIRHEVAQAETWKNPPSSLELNDAVAMAILLCVEHDQDEASIVLRHADCLAIDACVPQAARGVDGEPLGRRVLLKSYRARKAIAGLDLETVAEPPIEEEVHERSNQWRANAKRRD